MATARRRSRSGPRRCGSWGGVGTTPSCSSSTRSRGSGPSWRRSLRGWLGEGFSPCCVMLCPTTLPRGFDPMRRSNGLSLLLVALSSFACGGGAARAPRQRVLDPPRLDLRPFGRVGLVLFTVEGARGSLNELATQPFSEYVLAAQPGVDRKSTRLNSSHLVISYAVFCLKKKK